MRIITAEWHDAVARGKTVDSAHRYFERTMRPVSTERVQKGVAQIWERDLSLTLMLIILVLLLFVVVPLSTLGDISSTGDVLLSGLVSLMGISGAVSGSDTRLGRATGIALMTLPTLLSPYDFESSVAFSGCIQTTGRPLQRARKSSFK